jgi:glycosyltransferase involved in cell wall biosynthesis
VRFAVLSTVTDPSLPLADSVDGVTVARVRVDVTSAASKAVASLQVLRAFLRVSADVEIVHLHGFSQKSVLLTVLARLFGKRLVVKLTSVGHDDPLTMKRKGGAMFRAYASADRFVGVSPRFAELYREAALPGERLRVVPNGVDLDRFRPASPDERRARRARLGLPADLRLFLFVGFFSHEKAPALFLDAWLDVAGSLSATGVVFVGATRGRNAEIDPSIADAMKGAIRGQGVEERVVFVERSDEIESYYAACDAFVLPSVREGLPNAVLEAMASGLPIVVSRLPGVTDWLIDDGVNGRLVPAGDRTALGEALREVVCQPARAAAWGASARADAERRFAMAAVADRYFDIYQELVR